MTCCFAPDTASVQAQAPDASRHVNYVRGLVLDVDDFTQEFAYLSGRDQSTLRDVIGFGTTMGLKVAVSEDAAAPADGETRFKVMVAAGRAVDPCGRLICVPKDQCAYINRWLAGQQDAVNKVLGSAGTTLRLHVVLSYAQCLTATVPIPGEPCRTEDALKAPSRVADDFVLDFALEAPVHAEEAGLRDFAQWLRAIPMAASTSSHTRAEFAKLVAAWRPGADTPPADLSLAAADVADYLRDALRLWATELRQLVYGRDCGCAAPSVEHDPRLLLATLEFEVLRPVGQAPRVKALPVVDESRRPVLVHSRLLAECQARAGAAATRSLAAAGTVLRTVAAGQIGGDNVATGPVYGGLQVAGTGTNTVAFTFDGYAQPDAQHQYLVKVLGVASAKDPAPVVRFKAYTATGFELSVNPGAKANTPRSDMQAHSFMLQVDEIRL